MTVALKVAKERASEFLLVRYAMSSGEVDRCKAVPRIKS